MLIRPANPDTDYVRIAELLQLFERQPVTADTLREWDRREGGLRYRSVAVNGDGQIVGYGMAARDAWDKPGFFVCWAIVDPVFRCQGIGAQLFDDALAFARRHGAQQVAGEVMDNDAASLRFAEKRGFSILHHVFESTIRLADFDENRFAGLIESVEAAGIRLFSLAEAGDNDDHLRKLWEVNYHTALDDPASTGHFPDFPEFRNILRRSTWFRPNGQILAAAGDRYIGLSAVGYFGETNSAYNMMTGVLPEYRGRKIASALKLLSIRAAKGWGVDFIRTNNDSQNAPMLAINRKLGYQPQPGVYRLLRNLD